MQTRTHISAAAKATLETLATHAKTLGIGLEAAAPAARSVSANHSVLYLLSISEALQRVMQSTAFLTETSTDVLPLLQCMHDLIVQDEALRTEYHIGDKFRFVRDQLQGLLHQIEEIHIDLQLQKIAEQKKLTEEETIVFVHLFNSQGANLSSWQKMLKPSVFYEHSINRPIYADKAGIEAFLRTKANPTHHGYIMMVIKKSDILPIQLEDKFGNALVKIKEGALHAEGMLGFVTNGNEYADLQHLL